MRVLFSLAALGATIALGSACLGAEGTYFKTVDTESIMIPSEDNSVLPASCESSSKCSDGIASDSEGLSCNKQLRFNNNACGCDCGNWRQNLVGFSGAEAFKTLADSDYPNNAGFVNGLNTSFKLGGSKIRAQAGGSLGVYDLKGRDFGPNRNQTENQIFLTTGLYKRSNICAGDRLSWGLVYDQLFDHQHGLFTDDIYLGQIRGITGIALNQTDEVGFWGTAHTNRFTGRFATSYQSINQYNLYWAHNYQFGARTMFYAGIADKASVGSWTSGAQLLAPISNRLSVYGNSAFMFPSSANGFVGSNELLWAMGCGLSYSFGGKAVSRNISGSCGMPLQSVANNGTFMVDGNNSFF